MLPLGMSLCASEGMSLASSSKAREAPITDFISIQCPSSMMVTSVASSSQSGMPTKEEGLRVIGNLVRPDGVLAPKTEVVRVGIGTRVRMVFTDVAPGLALPQWTIDESAASGPPWRYRG